MGYQRSDRDMPRADKAPSASWIDFFPVRHGQTRLASPSGSDSLFSAVGSAFDYFIDRFAPSPWAPPVRHRTPHGHASKSRQLYTAEERTRRDSTKWTLVQGILAPLQLLVFMVSAWLVLRYLSSGIGYEVASASVIAKTMILYLIMVTGSIWEKKVFGKYLFAPAFFWEDVVSMLVIALHTAYLIGVLTDWGTPYDRMMIAVAAYTSYVVNATQFILKFRLARLESTTPVTNAAE